MSVYIAEFLEPFTKPRSNISIYSSCSIRYCTSRVIIASYSREQYKGSFLALRTDMQAVKVILNSSFAGQMILSFVNLLQEIFGFPQGEKINIEKVCISSCADISSLQKKCTLFVST